MNDQPVTLMPGATPSGRGGLPAFSANRSWKIGLVIAAIMVLLALLGVGLSTTASSATARTFWVALVPVYGALCVGAAWSRPRHGGGVSWPLVLRQLLHWLAIAVILALDFYVRGSGEETGVASGLNAMLLLALGCILAGVHFDWLFVLVGLLLTLTLICVTKAEQYLWLIFLVGGLAVVIMLVVMRMLGAEASRKNETPHSTPSATAGT